ncbi:hypothetical protein C7974DRAFT_405656 [Boeremia exigua]|uniref:uncharacterized protein n=1 Tax=Boeremia exigua TaxID=749465 RepID=UPI001E8E36DB|nr:uncharacterized protein C7974DRAFT_405656 [Boeremia exigua]KAH6612482.1 hypothetical protein C7974DRAFT_405656 [Boeremia exigua]
MSCSHHLASFPQLTDLEFEEACGAILKQFELQAHRQDEWTAVENVLQSETTVLRITKPLGTRPDVSNISDDTDDIEVEEEDDEIAESATPVGAVIQYDVVLSVSYRVPVLYFTISDSQHRYPPTMETLYSHIIPPSFRAQTESVGVIGGITVTDHPATNQPAFFIHPCRTAELMHASVGGRDITAYDYLLIWMGALGQCVGLKVPLSLVNLDQRHG